MTLGNDPKYLAYLKTREWHALRAAVRKRANGICERCRRNRMYATHHLTYKRIYREKLKDLQGLCYGCHNFVHGRSDVDLARPMLSWIKGKLKWWRAL